MRWIIHVDMDAFYASVEEMDNPELRGKPVIVSGSPEGRGVVSSASYEARRYGIYSAMPASRARRLCPHGIFLEARMERYAEVSRELLRIFGRYTPLVEPASLDEAYLDVTDTEGYFGGAEAVGREIKRRIKDELGLTASVGIGPNKFLAKLASDLEKPDGFVAIKEEEKEAVLKDLPVSKVPGVGKATEKILKQMGISTIGQLRELPLERLVDTLGKWGEGLYYLSRGIDDALVVTEWETKSVGRSITFERDIKDLTVIRRQLYELAEEVTRELRQMDRRARTVVIKIRYSNFKTITRGVTLQAPTDLVATIWQNVDTLLRERVDLKDKAVRLVGITLSGLTTTQTLEQLDLFEAEESPLVQGATEQTPIDENHGSLFS